MTFAGFDQIAERTECLARQTRDSSRPLKHHGVEVFFRQDRRDKPKPFGLFSADRLVFNQQLQRLSPVSTNGTDLRL